MLDSFMPSCFLILWISGVLLSGGFVRAEGFQGGRAVQAQGQPCIGDCWLCSSLARASQIPVSLTGGFEGLIQCFCLVSWQKPEISVHLVLRLYNFPSDSVPKLSSFCKAAQLPRQSSPTLATIRHPKQGNNFHLSGTAHPSWPRRDEHGPDSSAAGGASFLMDVPRDKY